MIYAVRSMCFVCVVALGGLPLAGCIGDGNGRTQGIGNMGNTTTAGTTETRGQAARPETGPQLAPGTGILATGVTGSVSGARRMDITSYDDGRSCPAD